MTATVPTLTQDSLAISVASAVAAANCEALRLGYNISAMLVRVTQGKGEEAGLWRIYYDPNNVNQRGGDVNIWISAEDYSVARVLRGQ